MPPLVLTIPFTNGHSTTSARFVVQALCKVPEPLAQRKNLSTLAPSGAEPGAMP